VLAAALAEMEEEKSHIFSLLPLPSWNTESRRLVLIGGKGMGVCCPCIVPLRRESDGEKGERGKAGVTAEGSRCGGGLHARVRPPHCN
jgi:hypothetical protein